MMPDPIPDDTADEPCSWCNDEGVVDGYGETHPCCICGSEG